MEGTAPLNTTTEYVIQLEEGHILQSQDLEQIVSLAIVNSNGNQVYTLQDGTIAAIGPGMYENGDVAEHVVTSHLQLEEADQRVNVISAANCTETVDGAEGGVILCQNSEQEHALQSYTLTTSDGGGIDTTGSPVMITVPTDGGKTQKKCAKRKRANQNVSAISKDMVAVDQRDETVVVQPFTVETITNTLRSGRAYNTTKTIYDYLMYEKFPPGYTTNQKQALREVKDNYIIVDKQLYYRCKKGKIVRLLLVIHDEQPDVKLKILQNGHISKSGSHNGINKTIGQIKEFFFWHGLTDHVRLFVKSCHLCHLRQAVAKEREKLVHLNMEHTPTFSVSSEGQALSDKVDRLVKEHKKLQNNLRPYESSELVETIKKNVAQLNHSILSHLELSQHVSGETVREITSLTGEERNIIAGGDERSSNENKTVEDDGSDKIEDLKLLDTMMPNKRVHNHSRLIEEIIRTNTYPKTLNAGQISGLAQVKTHFLMVNDELYRVFSKRGRMLNVAKVIHDDEPDMKKKIMKVCHVEESGKHNGMNRTLTIVNESFYWQSMSIHIKMFVEYCPVCRNRRGVSSKMSNSYVAETTDISDICLKLSTEPKETCQEVEGSLGLTPEDYLTVRQLAEEVKDLNEWLFKNPTIKDEWEHMFERSFRGSKGYDYDEDGMRIYRKNNSDKGLKDFTSNPFKFVENFDSGRIQIIKKDIDDETLEYDIAEVRDQSSQTDTGGSISSSAEVMIKRSNMTEMASGDSVVQSEIDGAGIDYIAWNVSLNENGDVIEGIKVGDAANNENDKDTNDDKDKKDNVSNDESPVEDVRDDSSDECEDKNESTMDTNEDIKTGDVDCMYNKQKVSKAENINQEKSVGCSVLLERNSLEGNMSDVIDNAESSPTNSEEKDVRRSSKRLESKLLSRKETYKKPVKTKLVTSIAKKNKTDRKEASISIKEETEATLSCRHSARKRKMTPKFSGFVKSKRLETLAGSACSETEQADPAKVSSRFDFTKDAAADGSDSQNVKRKKSKDEQKEEQMASPVKHLEDDISDKQNEEVVASPVKQLEDKKSASTETGVAKTKTKPIMQSTNIKLVARKPRTEVHAGKDSVKKSAILVEDKGIDGPVTRRKAKGIIMKNSDVHIVKRKTKEDQISNILDNSKNMKVSKLSEQNLSTVTQGQNQVNTSSRPVDNSQCPVPENDEKAKTIFVPRNRKGLMTKTDFNVIRRKSVETISAGGKTDFTHHKESLGISSDKKMDGEENVQTEVGMRHRQNSLLSEQPSCDSKGNTSIYSQSSCQQREFELKSQETNSFMASDEKTVTDSLLETHLGESDVIGSERLRDKSLTKGQQSGRTPEKNMKYVIDFKKNKQDTAESSYQKKYKEFVGADTAKSKCIEIHSDAATYKDMPANEICITNKGDANILSNQEKSITGNTSNEMEGNHKSDFVAYPLGKTDISSHFNYKERIVKLGSPIVIIKVNNELATSGGGCDNILQDISQTKCGVVRHIDDKIDNSNTFTSDTAMHYSEERVMLPQQNYNTTLHSKTSLETTNTVKRIRKEDNNTQDCQTLSRNFDCPLCMKRFDDEKSYFLHKGDLCKVECQFCSLLFDAKQKGRIDKHVLKHKAGFCYKCSDCENVFLSRGMLNIHKRIHADDRELICTECNETFHSFFYLTSHCETEHDIPVVYICDICSARFGSKDFLTERQLSNGNLSFYSCTLCESKI